MRMHDWNGYRAQVVTGVGNLSKLSPDTVRGYTMLSGSRHEDQPAGCQDPRADLARRGRTPRCDGCITVHTDARASSA